MSATSQGVAGNAVAVTEFIREYLDNGLAAYDADRRRFGTVADYNRSGSCFVVRTSAPDASLCIPFSLVRQVRRGRVYVSKSARVLTGRPSPSAALEQGSSANALRQLFRTLFRSLED
jgi:hypothetical protein